MKRGETIRYKNQSYTVVQEYKEKGFVRVKAHGYPSQMLDIKLSELTNETYEYTPKPSTGTTYSWSEDNIGRWLYEFQEMKRRQGDFTSWAKPDVETTQLPLPTTEGVQYHSINELLNEGKEMKPEETAQENTYATKPNDPYGSMFDGIIEEAKRRVEKAVDEKMDGELSELRKAIKEKQTLEIQMGEVTGEVKGTRHRQLPELLLLAGMRLPTLLIGMAGTGKTHAAEQVAEGLSLPFYAMSVGAQTSKSDIVGYMNATGKYISTHFRSAYENGGVFLMDEIDAGNANVLIQINAALSNGKAAFPDKMIAAHKDFVFIASANTFGTGANRQYVGRNQLDAATLDRFTVLEWGIDVELEQKLSGENTNWYAAVVTVRDLIAREQIRALITPRATVRGGKLLSAGVDLNKVIDSCLLGTVPEDKKKTIKEAALLAYSGGRPGVGAGKGSSMPFAGVAF